MSCLIFIFVEQVRTEATGTLQGLIEFPFAYLGFIAAEEDLGQNKIGLGRINLTAGVRFYL